MADPQKAINSPLDIIDDAQRMREDHASASDWIGRLLDAIGDAVGRLADDPRQDSPGGRSVQHAASVAAALVLRAHPDESATAVLGAVAKRHARAAAHAPGGQTSLRGPMEQLGAAIKHLPLIVARARDDADLPGVEPMLAAVLDHLLAAYTLLQGRDESENLAS